MQSLCFIQNKWESFSDLLPKGDFSKTYPWLPLVEFSHSFQRPACWLGEFSFHYGVCAEKAIKVFVQINSRRWPKNALKGLATWELNEDEIGYPALSDQLAHLYNSQQDVWEHIISLGK